jgi:DNA-binding response OmpR family regulator
MRKHYNVLTARNGIEAIEIAKSKHPDLILMDVLMPKMHGLECCSAIRDDPDIKHIPIMIVTSMSDPQTEIMALRAGARDYVKKPFDCEILQLRIKNLLEPR